MSERAQAGADVKRPRTVSVGDIAATVLVFAAGVVFVILAIRSVPAWWTTTFEFPPPTLNTLALAGAAFISFLITWSRVSLQLLSEIEVPYVSRISGGRVEVWEGSVAARPVLRRLGGRRNFMTPGSWRFRAPDEPSLARLLTALRDAGVGFGGNDPKGWTPSDEFVALRERGLVSGSFDEIGVAGVARRR